MSCNNSPQTSIEIISATAFNPNNENGISLYTLKNKNGMHCQITNYGGRVISLWTPDRNGDYEDIVLGYSTLEEYITNPEAYFGSIIGRYANRIGVGLFVLDSVTYNLAKNNNGHHLHGGPKGFHNVVWNVEEKTYQKLKMSYISPDMEEGFPGELNVTVIYELTEDNSLKITYHAETNAPTIVNLSHHSYFNLKGSGNGTINDHYLSINADYFTPVDNGLIPTGEIRSVANTPMDFKSSKQIGQDLNKADEQLKIGGGYDHNWVLNSEEGVLVSAATVFEESSGRVLEVITNEPGIQFYGGNFLNGELVGKGNKPYQHQTALCLETQHFPDSPNKENFPSTRLDPGEVYNSVCIYKFSVK